MAKRDPFGPVTTNADYYLPPEYYSVAQPAYPTNATHEIVQGYSAGLVGLYTGFATVATRKAPQADLNKKGEWVDSLGPGTGIIVFREACGYKGQWSEVVVVGNRYHTDVQIGPNIIEKKKLYLRSDALRSLTIESHPIVDEDDIVSPTDATIPSNWRSKVLEKPYFDNRAASYCVVVEHRIDDPGSRSDIRGFMTDSLESGRKMIFDYYNKDGPESGPFFIFARATEYHIESRPADYSSSIKVLVQIPQIYFDTYKDKGASFGSQLSQGLSDVADSTNRYLDSNNGMAETQAIREGIFSGLDDDTLRSEATVENIFGEEIEFVQEDWARELLINPEDSAARSQESIDALGNAINNLPEHLYNRFIPGELRDTIEDATKWMKEAYATATEFSDDLTKGLDNALKTVTTITTALENAPDFASTNAALESALTNPDVDLAHLTIGAIGGTQVDRAARRQAADRDLASVLLKLEGTLIKQRYDWIKQRYDELLFVSEVQTEVEQFAQTGSIEQWVKQDLKKIELNYEKIEETIKRIDFYSSFTPDELISGLGSLSALLKTYEDQKDSFQGDINGWRPKYDADRVDLIFPKINIYLRNLIEDYDRKIPVKFEFGFSRNHKLIYVGYVATDLALVPFSDRNQLRLRSLWGINQHAEHPDAQETFHFHGDSSLGSHVSGTPPLDSETIMAYLWKLNDSTKEGNLKLTQWGSKYVFPRPTFIPKPRLTSDVTEEIKRLEGEILTLKNVEKQKNGFQNTELRLRQGMQAVNHIEQKVDTFAADINKDVDKINNADDVFFDWLAAASSEMNPYVAGLIKCVTPKIDIDLLPEIPDIDLSIIRNPVMKFIELTDAIIPSDPNWQLKVAAEKAWEQAKKLVWVTAVKMVLEYYAAACLQLQAFAIGEALDAIDNLMNPDPADVDLDLAGGAQTRQALEDSSLLNSFRDSNLLPLDGLSDSESIEKIRALFSDVTSLLSSVEVCQLTSGLAPPYVIELVRSLISIKHPHFVGVLDSRSKIQDLFISIGDIVNHNLCDEIISNHENETYNTSYGSLACDISKELAEVRRSLLRCQPGLTPEMIEDIIARENENTLRTLRTVLENLGSDKTIPPLDIETDATKHAKKMAFKSLFSPVERSLNKELKEYSKFMSERAVVDVGMIPTPEALEILHSKAAVDTGEDYRFALPGEVLMGTRQPEELPFATEIATFFRTQIETIETNEEFQDFQFNIFDIEEEEGGIKIKLRSLGQSTTTDDQLIDIATRTGWAWHHHHKPYNESVNWGEFDNHAQSYFNEVVKPNLPYQAATQEHLMKRWREEGFEVHMNCREYEDQDNQYYQTGIVQLKQDQPGANKDIRYTYEFIPTSAGVIEQRLDTPHPTANFGWHWDKGSWDEPYFVPSGRPNAAQKMPPNITDWIDAERWLEGTITEQSADFKKNVKEEEGDKIRIHDMTYAYKEPIYEVTKGLAPDASTFELSYKLHNTAHALGNLFSQIGSALNSSNTGENTPEINKKGNYSIVIKNLTSGESMFDFSSNIETSDRIHVFLQERFPDIGIGDLFNTNAAPQQIYFENFINPNTESSEELESLLRYGIFLQITRDIISFLGRKIANSKYFKFSDKEENGSKLSNLEALELQDKSLFNMDVTLDGAVEKYIKNKKSDLPPPRDATVQRINYNAFEVAAIEQSIKAMVRVYVIEYFVKGLFVASSFRTIGEAKDIAKDYLLEKIKSDIPKQFTTIFNYKFFYLARGIYQDNLETELTEVDQDIDYIIKKHIAEQYDVVSKQWDEIIQKDLNAESFEAEQQLKDLEKRLSEDPEDAKRYRWTQSKKAEKEGANLTNTTLEYLNQLPERDYIRSVDNIMEFYGDEQETFQNGSFYFEKRVKISYSNGTEEILSFDEFNEKKPEEEISWIFEFVASLKLFVKEHTGDLDSSSARHWFDSLKEQLLDLAGQASESAPSDLFDELVTEAQRIATQQDPTSALETWNNKVDNFAQQLSEAYNMLTSQYGISSIFYELRLMYMMPSLASLANQQLTGFSSLLSPTDYNAFENIDIAGSTIISGVKLFVTPLLSAEVSSQFSDTTLWSGLLDASQIYNNLKQEIISKEEMKFLFDYVFPIEKYKTLMSIYTVESMNELPGLESMFVETKTNLRTVFNKMDSRGRFGYKGPDKDQKLEEE